MGDSKKDKGERRGDEEREGEDREREREREREKKNIIEFGGGEFFCGGEILSLSLMFCLQHESSSYRVTVYTKIKN